MSRLSQGRPPRGVALVVVLWVVAALTVLVSGLVAAQRSELRSAGSERGRLQAMAAGAAAMAVALQSMQGSTAPPGRLQRQGVRIDERDIVVEIVPLTGLVDLNLAPQPLLVAVLRDLGGRVDAEVLAAALVARRQIPAASPGGAPNLSAGALFSVEQLLALPGVDPDLVARIRPFVTTGSGGSGKVNPLAAPIEVLKLLTRGDEALALRFGAERDSATAMIDTTRLEGSLIDTSTSSRLRLTALVPSDDGVWHAVRRDVEVGRSAAPGMAPWRVLDQAVTRMPARTNDGHR